MSASRAACGCCATSSWFEGVVAGSPMNRTLLSLCLFGTALATGNVLLMQRPTCPSAGAWAGAADADRPAAKPDGAPAAKPQRLGAAAEIKPANFAFWTEPSKGPATLARLPLLPKDVEITGSVKQTAKADQKSEADVKMPGDPDLVPPPQPKPRAKTYRPRQYGWRRHYRYPRPPMGFAIRVYPGW